MKGLKKLTLIPILILIVALTNFTIAIMNVHEVEAATPTLTVGKVYNMTEVGSTFIVNITVSDISEMGGWVLSLKWDPNMIEISKGDQNGLYKRTGEGKVYYNIYEGEFMKEESSTTFIVNKINETSGTIVSLACFFAVAGISVGGSGRLAFINFTLLNVGQTSINITQSTLLDRNGRGVDHNVENGLVTNLPPPSPPPIWMQPWFPTTVAAVTVAVAVPIYIIRLLKKRVPLTREEIEKIKGYEEVIEGKPLPENFEETE